MKSVHQGLIILSVLICTAIISVEFQQFRYAKKELALAKSTRQSSHHNKQSGLHAQRALRANALSTIHLRHEAQELLIQLIQSTNNLNEKIWHISLLRGAILARRSIFFNDDKTLESMNKQLTDLLAQLEVQLQKKGHIGPALIPHNEATQLPPSSKTEIQSTLRSIISNPVRIIPTTALLLALVTVLLVYQWSRILLSERSLFSKAGIYTTVLFLLWLMCLIYLD